MAFPFSAREDPFAPDLLLQLENAVEQRFRGGWATRHVDINGNYTIAAAYDRVGVVVIAPAIGAGAHRNHPARLGHLVIDLAECRRHLVGERAGDDHHVRLAWARSEHDAEAVEVIARSAGVHHLDGAAGEPEGHRPERAGARPVYDLVELFELGDEEALVANLFGHLAQHRLGGGG